uniref:Uncharacterized protein n=1 Tax=Utricularia reniformis TaxID=192314 RepID=A0A1Y0B180_9LAMI|nr:hypothetical protein AEK19_MT0910 [Utricularia reniformis]ART31138.1 hypothetical protein AEK19_MT0910 [Utricularia reniformis]
MLSCKSITPVLSISCSSGPLFVFLSQKCFMLHHTLRRCFYPGNSKEERNLLL